MGLIENMMKGMMGNMSTEEKKEMMESMMAHFFGSMTADEKKELMAAMMPKMMQQMMGGGGMMGMMAGMMGGKKSDNCCDEEEGSNPMDMCKEMMLNLKESRQTAMIATPELQGLFLDWIQHVEEEVLSIISKKKSVDVDAIAAELKLSSESISYLIARLSAAKKVKVEVKI